MSASHMWTCTRRRMAPPHYLNDLIINRAGLAVVATPEDVVFIYPTENPFKID